MPSPLNTLNSMTGTGCGTICRVKLFISWSGERSRSLAAAVSDYFPRIIHALKPFLSDRDLEKGSLWPEDIARELRGADAGIICLTAENIHSDWLLFEAGALSKPAGQAEARPAVLCTYLLGLAPNDVPPPLGLFQATRAEEKDTFKLLSTLNRKLETEALRDDILKEQFATYWPKLEDAIGRIPKSEVPPPVRGEADMMQEMLGMLRGMTQTPSILRASRLGESFAWNFERPADAEHFNLLVKNFKGYVSSEVHGNKVLGTVTQGFPADYALEVARALDQGVVVEFFRKTDS